MSQAVTHNARPIPILTYHQIAPAPPKGTPFRSLCVAPADFARQMGLLKLLGYQGLSMTDLMPYLQGARSGKVVGITFDDGYQNNLIHALPVLQRHGFSATCYVVSELVGKTNVWDREIGIPQVPLMTKEELQLWIAGGQEVGAHTRTHAHLSAIEPISVDVEVGGCRSDLELLLGREVSHFCYPYGEYTPEIVEAVQKNAYLSATTTQRGRCQAGTNMYAVPRVPIARTVTLAAFWWKLVSTYEDKHGDARYG